MNWLLFSSVLWYSCVYSSLAPITHFFRFRLISLVQNNEIMRQDFSQGGQISIHSTIFSSSM